MSLNWQSVLQFLHKERTNTQQRELDHQLQRNQLMLELDRLRKELDSQRSVNSVLKKRVKMLQKVLKENNPKLIPAIAPPLEKKLDQEKNYFKSFIQKVQKQLREVNQVVKSVPDYEQLQYQRKVQSGLELTNSLKFHLDSVRKVVWTTQKILASAGQDCLINLYDVSRNTNTTIREHLGPVFSLCHGQLGNNSLLFSGGTEGIINCFSLQQSSPNLIGVLSSDSERPQTIWQLHFHNKMLGSLSADKKIRLYQINMTQQGKCSLDLKRVINKSQNKSSRTSTATSMCFLSGNRVGCAFWQQKSIVINNLQSKGADTVKYTSQQSYSQANQLIQFQSRLLVSAHQDRAIRLFDLKSLRLVKNIPAHHDSISTLATFDNFIVSGSNDGHIVMWDMRTFQRVCQLKSHERKFEEGCISLSCCKGGLASGGADQFIKLYKYR